MSQISLAASLALSAAIIASSPPPAHAATFSVLYKFLHPGLGYPQARVDLMNGNLFGTGAGDGVSGDNGQVFELTNSGGTWSVTASDVFNGTDGSMPYGGLIHDSNGNFYGTTSAGDVYGGGNAFYTFNSGGTLYLERIWAFGGTGDGADPTGDLIRDSAGNLYGTTQLGGAYGSGIAFELTYTNIWTETILHNFGNGSDGATPYAGLMMDSSGNLYGTTVNGGTHRDGTVFELTQSGGTWSEKILHSFAGGTKDGKNPYGSLIRNSKGVLYGTTEYGGAYACSATLNCGTVFKVYLSGGGWKEKVLINFDTGAAYPSAKLTWGATTNALYGATSGGGAGTYGTVFKLTYSSGVWSGTILHNFTGSDGAFPVGAVSRDSSGNLYGTTLTGGGDCGCGTVWELTP